MPALPFPDRRFMQFCWVVPDLEAAMAAWTNSAGVGPFFFFENVTYDTAIYRGKPWEPVKFKAAIAQAGDVQIELVCQLDDRPSMFRDIVPAGKSGFHHAALYCADYDASLAAYTNAGAEVAFSGLMMGSPVCWVDTSATLGFMVELITANPIAESIFGQIRAAGQNWDGKDPVRTLS
jgi:hypothetical protein